MKLFDLMYVGRSLGFTASAIGSTTLAAIFYQTSLGDFVYQTDSNGNVVLDNQGTLTSAYDGLPYSGRGIELGALNDVDIPIHHTLGSEEITGSSWTIDNVLGGATITSSNNTASTLNLAVTAVGTRVDRPFINIASTANDVLGKYILVKFNAVVNSGTCIIRQIYNGVSQTVFDHTVVNGENTLIYESSNTNADLYIYFNGTNLFDVELTNISSKQITNPNSYLTYYDFTDGLVTVDNSLNTQSTKYTLNTKTVNNIITHTTPWSASDWARINNNPNLIGKLALETLGATKTIPELDMVIDAGASADSYYMCSENSGAYLVDSRVAYGAETVQQGDFSTDTVWIKGTGWSVDTISGTASCDGTQVGTSPLYQNTFVPTVGRYYIILFDVLSISAGGVYGAIGGGDGIIKTTSGKHGSIVKAVTTTAMRIYANADFVGTIDNVSIREATATEIANYAETIRTNADLQQKGIQQTAFVTDGAGVPTSYSDNLLQFNGDGRYVDTGWIPNTSGALSTEIVIKRNTTASSNYIGCSDSATARYGFGYVVGGNARVLIGDAIPSFASTGIDHIILITNGTPSESLLYINGVLATWTKPTVTATPISNFMLGRQGADTAGKNINIGLFKRHDRILTASEVATAYAKAKAIYPTLP